ncbi:calcyclin-binding protein-like [Homarus americanus]|uniref:calcyclin-binding protein-like n=1 Tax=Homarus americanus TaxID=6706 RepID=UPI001C46B636|nr:calcyclin-binding protein-like [Homarus americanus]
MSNKIEEMLKDVEELRTLVASATRKRIQDLLSQELRKMEIEVAHLQEESLLKPSEQKAKPATASTYTVILRNYSWDESDKFMKIYISLKNVQGLEKDAITTTFSKRGVQVMVKELDGKNYDLNITNLAKNINPDASYHKVKTDMLVVLLSKSEQGKWTGVTAEDVRASEARKPKMSSDDPNAGMMDLMKQMYDDGDDKMKQMLNKTWYESQQKTLRGGGNEMTMPGMDNLNL